MTVIGISDDEPEDSRAFADDLGIEFPLVYDEEAAYAQHVVGKDTDGNALPGVVVLLPGRRVHFRRVAEVKDDRVHAPALLDAVDEALAAMGQTAPATRQIRGGFTPVERLQIHVGAEAGALVGLSDADTGAALGGSADVSLPLGRYGLAGLRVAASGGDDARIDVALAPRLRLPTSGDLAEYYLLLPVGLAIDPTEDDPMHHTLGAQIGARVGLQFAWTPSLGFFLDAGATLRRFGGDEPRLELQPSGTLGLVVLP